jgi:hypothetical protein
MRQLTIALTATAAILLAGSLAWKAEATTPGGDTNVPAAAKNFSPVMKAACRGLGGRCGPGLHWVCGPHGHCWCAPC